MSHAKEKHLPRGIDPELLLSQVKNTMPYLFAAECAATALGQLPPARTVKDFANDTTKALNHFEYFRLCLSSHFLTCATPVPTDVDNQIRRKLWPAELPLDTALEMASLVVEIRKWDLPALSARFTYGALASEWEKATVSGHLGEWFTVAAGAYCAMRQYKEPAAFEKGQELFEEIADEVRRHSEIFGSLWRAQEGLECLKASASIAHNFGDLDRVMDMWDLDAGDPLRLEYYKLTAKPFDTKGKLRFLGRLWVAGELYKAPIGGSAMALENHRHFALRKPKCLRASPEFRVPIGPFFDDWGRRVAKGAADPLEVIEALRHGRTRLPPQTLGYVRALLGMAESLPAAAEGLPSPPQAQFEREWHEAALKHMDDIPSRATL